MKELRYSLVLSLLLPLSVFGVNEKGVDTQLYGFLKTSVTYADQSINSFSNTNLVAPTSAGNQSINASGNDRSTFQVAQSRLGVNLSFNSKTRGLAEVDFIDFSQSSPTTQSRPRLRRLFIERDFAQNWSVRLGQDWDTFSPLRPDTFDIIGLYFNGGNTGFMREALKLRKSFKNGRFELALGQANKNTAVGTTDIEEKHQQSLAANGMIKFTDKFSLSLSGIVGSKLSYSQGKKNPFGLSLGAIYQKGDVKFVFESYTGEGLSELNILDLSGSKFATSTGGYLTFKRYFTQNLGVLVGQGGVYRNQSGVSQVLSNKSYSNLGLSRNLVSRLGSFYEIDLFKFYGEFTHFSSQYQQTSNANTIEFGFIATI